MHKAVLLPLLVSNTLYTESIPFRDFVAAVVVTPSAWSSGAASVAVMRSGVPALLYDANGDAVQLNGGTALSGNRAYAVPVDSVLPIVDMCLVASTLPSTTQTLTVMAY